MVFLETLGFYRIMEYIAIENYVVLYIARIFLCRNRYIRRKQTEMRKLTALIPKNSGDLRGPQYFGTSAKVSDHRRS